MERAQTKPYFVYMKICLVDLELFLIIVFIYLHLHYIEIVFSRVE